MTAGVSTSRGILCGWGLGQAAENFGRQHASNHPMVAAYGKANKEIDMGLWDTLTGRAKRNEQSPPPFPDASTPAQVRAQSDEPAISEAILADPSRRSELKGEHVRKVSLDQMTFAIDYRDITGVETRRPVTIVAIHADSGHPILDAFCHVRSANRSFRIDRIENVISTDGEVFETHDFFRRTFDIDLRAFAKGGTKSDPLEGARQVRAALRPMLSILVLAARADDEFHAEELDVILRYAERELIALEKLGTLVTPITVEMLEQ